MWILRILGPIKFCEGPIKISNGSLIFGNFHVFERDMGHWPILNGHHHFGLGLTLLSSWGGGAPDKAAYCVFTQFRGPENTI